jgi:hypothetical protein
MVSWHSWPCGPWLVVEQPWINRIARAAVVAWAGLNAVRAGMWLRARVAGGSNLPGE